MPRLSVAQQHKPIHTGISTLVWLLALAVITTLWTDQATLLLAQGNNLSAPITCFAAANRPGEGILLAWRSSMTDTTTIKFEMARAQFTSPLGEMRGPLIPEGSLAHLQARTGEPDNGELRYTVVDSMVADDTKYAYVLTVTNTISGTVVAVDEETWTYEEDAGTPLQNDEICLSTSAIGPWTPTFTPTPTDTLTPLPSNTPTPTVTATPTWTHTPTITPTPTWTATFTPGPTHTPYPSPTFTSLPTETPIPPTETTSPTFTATPTWTPSIMTPTPEFGAAQNPDPSAIDPFNNSVLPTPTGTTEIVSSTLANDTDPPLTITTELPADSPATSVAAIAAVQPEIAPAQLSQSPASHPTADLAIAAEPSESTAIAARAVQYDPAAVRSEYPPSPPQINSFPLLRFALYAVGGLAFLSAIAFLLGALALFGKNSRS